MENRRHWVDRKIRCEKLIIASCRGTNRNKYSRICHVRKSLTFLRNFASNFSIDNKTYEKTNIKYYSIIVLNIIVL